MILKYVQSNTLYQAGSGNIIGATTIVLTSFADIYGNVLTMADFGAKGYITCEPDTTNEEAMTFTSVTANANGTYTLGGISSALAKSPYTETSGTVRQHSGGTKVVITDSAAFWNTFVNKNDNETIVGKYTFPGDNVNRPTFSSDVDTTTPTDPVTFGQLSRQAIAGAANASTTVKGIIELATQAEVDARSTTGGTGALLVPTPDTTRSTLLSDYVATDSGSANAYAIAPTPAITAYVAGQRFTFKAANASTGASTLAVSALAVKSIKKADGATAIGTNDIKSGQIVEVEYDGTNFQMLTPSAVTPAYDAQNKIPEANVYFDYQLFTSSGTWNKPTGLTGNEFVIVQVWGAGGAGGGIAASTGTAGGGGGGSYVEGKFRASDLTATVSVAVAPTTTGTTSNGSNGNTSSFGTYVTAYGGGGGSAATGGSIFGGGGGAGVLGAGASSTTSTSGAGGGPLGGAAGVDGGFGGGGGGANSAYGGGGGGKSGSGGNSLWGGGGGGSWNGATGTAGTSVFGGAGGAAAANSAGSTGVVPGGGGGGAQQTSSSATFAGGSGARGEIRVWVIS